MKKNNAFTLVELLAVVVVLAVVSLIAIPVITGIIKNTEKGALKSSATGLLESANMYYNLKTMKGNFDKEVEFTIINGVQTSEEKLDYKGSVKNAYLTIFLEGEVALCVDNGKYSATKSADTTEITISESICTGELDEASKSYLTSGTHNYGELSMNIKAYTTIKSLPKTASTNDVAVITNDKITGYYVSYLEPTKPTEGMVWLVSKVTTGVNITSVYNAIPVNYAVQYISGEWIIKDSYMYNGTEWVRLEYYDKND